MVGLRWVGVGGVGDEVGGGGVGGGDEREEEGGGGGGVGEEGVESEVWVFNPAWRQAMVSRC